MPSLKPRGRQHSFVEIDHELFSTVILSLPLIQEGQLSVSGERMCTNSGDPDQMLYYALHCTANYPFRGL